ARQWRSSQDTTGYTEPGGPDQDVLRPVSSDARLAVFDTADPETQTIAQQRGPVTAEATSYGQPFSYLPEHRAFAAIDGDLGTSWIVGDHGDPIGETIRLAWSEAATQMTLHQAGAPGDRHISRITLLENAGPDSSARTVELDARSWSAEGQSIPLLYTVGGSVDIEIEAVAGGEPFTPSIVAGVGFSEIDLGLGPTVEVVRPPHDALDDLDADTPFGLVFTRLRTDPMDRWRDDPEPRLVREFDLPTVRSFDVDLDVRIDARASDAELARLFGWPAVASSRLIGSPRHAGAAAIDGDPSTSWITAFDEAEGATLTISGVNEPIASLEVRQPVTGFTLVPALLLRSGGEERSVDLVPGADGTARVIVEPPLPPGDLEIELAPAREPTITIDRRFGDPFALPAAISEITLPGLPAFDPIGETSLSLPCTPLIDVDGDPVLASIEVEDDGWLDGAAVTATACEPGPTLAAGTHLLTVSDQAVAAPLLVDRVVLDAGIRSALADAPASTPTATVTESSRFDRTIEVSGCTDGCWLVLGEGYSTAWEAEGPDGALGEPVLIDGGFNGWWLAPADPVTDDTLTDDTLTDDTLTDDTVTVVTSWMAQGRLTVALVLSGLSALTAIALVVVDRRRSVPPIERRLAGPRWFGRRRIGTRRRALGLAGVWFILAGLLIGPIWLIWGAVGGIVVVLSRRVRLPELAALASLLVVSVLVIVRERQLAPVPDGGWPHVFESLHELGLFAVVGVLAGACFADDAVGGPDGEHDPADDHHDGRA
ncbi:MAG: hypothetical protein WKF60_10130, partial [Ilumatobacter sp.]